jgi:hypothetical protein
MAQGGSEVVNAALEIFIGRASVNMRHIARRIHAPSIRSSLPPKKLCRSRSALGECKNGCRDSENCGSVEHEVGSDTAQWRTGEDRNQQ